MTESSKIQWTDHTFNPWWGCARVSPACRFCYADTTATRWGHELWRRHGPRRMMADGNWRNPIRWNRAAQLAGRPAKVFCASMADVFEVHPVSDVNAQLNAARTRLWSLIGDTPWLTWQLLTKRPENVSELAPWGNTWPDNVWLGTSVETQRWADTRIPILSAIPAAVRFLSCEPLLAPVALPADAGIGWVIVGGESGAEARPMELGWARRIVDDCGDRGVPVFVKQLGEAWARDWCVGGVPVSRSDKKGGDPKNWPAALRVRQFPATLPVGAG